MDSEIYNGLFFREKLLWRKSCLRQPVTRNPEGGVTYATALAGSVTPSRPSGFLKPTDMESDMSEPTVSSETANRRMSSDMSGPLSDTPDGATPNAQVANACLPAGERPNKPPILFQVFVTPVPSWPGCGHPALAA